MLYGAAGHTGALIARHAHQRGHRPLLAGRNAPATAALAGKLDLPYLALALDDPAALNAALADVDLVLNAAGPFLHTAAPLAQACLAAGVHYIDIGNELQVFRTLYDLGQRAQQAGVTIIPGAGFGVVATNCLARYVSDAVGGAQNLEVAARAATARPGPGIAASVRENLPYGGWTRREGHLHPQPLGSGTITITLPGGPCRIMPFPTGDLEAAFQATGAPDITAYSPVPDDPAVDPPPSGTGPAGPPSTSQSDGHEPPARTAPPPKPGCKPASPTPLPPPPASAPSKKLSPDPYPGRSAPPRRSAPASPSPSRTPPGSTPSPQKPLPAVLWNEVTWTTCRQRR
jgi:short subunit dehydrogenase-like uncharacterized protein